MLTRWLTAATSGSPRKMLTNHRPVWLTIYMSRYAYNRARANIAKRDAAAAKAAATTNSQEETTMNTNTDPRTLTAGTVTEFGTTERATLTGWFMTDGDFVPFIRMARPQRAEILVTFG